MNSNNANSRKKKGGQNIGPQGSYNEPEKRERKFKCDYCHSRVYGTLDSEDDYYYYYVFICENPLCKPCKRIPKNRD